MIREGKEMYEKKGNRISKITVIMFIMSITLHMFFIPEEIRALQAGDIANVSFDGYLKGIENQYYTMDLNGNVLFYEQDGSTYVKNVKGNELSKRRHMILTDTVTGDVREGYCVEFDAELRARTSYTGNGYMADTLYFNNLPEDVKKLILAVTYYGKNGKNELPAEGVNDEDYYFATQMMIWEAQQQIRVLKRDDNGKVTGSELTSAHGMPADFFYRYIKGRAAEKCYDYIAENIDKHFIVPDFIGETAAKAETVTLKYDMQTHKWHGKVKDLGNPFEMKCEDADIEYSKKDGIHSFTMDRYLNGEKTIKVKRITDEGSSAENLLIWNNNVNKDFQVVATGSASPPEFYMRFKTDIPAEVTISKKDSETGKNVQAEGTEYKIKCIDIDKYVSNDMKNPEGDIYRTDSNGKVRVDEKLQAGNYILEEIKAPKGYVVSKKAVSFIIDGKTESLTIKQENVPQKGVITISKIGEYKHNGNLSDIREKAMGGIDFDIVALADIVTADGTIRARKGEIVDTVRTDFNGNVSSKELYLGPYNLVEKAAPDNYIISDPVNIALVYAGQDIEVVEKKINVFNRLKKNEQKTDQSPKTYDQSSPDALIFVTAITFTLILILICANIFEGIKRKS